MLFICKDSFSWQQDGGCPAKQYERLHQGDLYAHMTMVCILLTEKIGLLNIKILSNMIGAECCLRRVPSQDDTQLLECDIQPVLIWRERGTISNSFVKGHNTNELTGWYEMESA